MQDNHDLEFSRLPGLYRLWDLQFVIGGMSDWQVEYAQMTEDGVPLFAVCRRQQARQEIGG